MVYKPKCVTCGREYPPRQSGWMISICDDCKNSPAVPERYIDQHGIFVPNPAFDEWELKEKARIGGLKYG